MHCARAGGRRRYKTPHLHVPPICLYLLCSALLAHQRFWTLRSIQRRGSGSTDRRWARAGPVRACVRAQVQVGRCEHESAHVTQGRRTAENRQAGRRVEQNPTPGPHRPSNGNAGDVFEPCVLTVIGWAPTIAHLLACYARSSTAHVVGRLHGGTVPWICMYVRVRWAFQKQREMVRAVPNPSRETPTPALPDFSDAPLAQTALRSAARRSCCATWDLACGRAFGPRQPCGMR